MKPINKAAQAMGRKGGAVTSEAKKATARANGKRGGRPPKTKEKEEELRLRSRRSGV